MLIPHNARSPHESFFKVMHLTPFVTKTINLFCHVLHLVNSPDKCAESKIYLFLQNIFDTSFRTKSALLSEKNLKKEKDQIIP